MEFVELINTLGFPIACVVACGMFIWKTTQQSREDGKAREERMISETKAREDRMFSQLDKFGDSLDNFNTTLVKIDARLGAVEKRLEQE